MLFPYQWQKKKPKRTIIELKKQKTIDTYHTIGENPGRLTRTRQISANKTSRFMSGHSRTKRNDMTNPHDTILAYID
jgi:hypothetical protein